MTSFFKHMTLVVALTCTQACTKPTPTFFSIDLTGNSSYTPQLALPDTEGKLRQLADFKGQVTVVFFGFTHCPDVCPLTMAELALVKKELAQERDLQEAKVQGVFVTLDPERDEPAKLKAYVQGFDPSFVALRGSTEQTFQTSKSFKVVSEKVQGSSPNSYSLDHTAGSYIFDRAGQLRLFTRFTPDGTNASHLKSDLRSLLKEGR